MYRVGAFASQFLISEAASSDMSHNFLKAVTVTNEMVLRGAVIVPEHLFIYIPEQMERLDGDVRPLESALEQRPEVFESVGVNLSVNVRSAWSIVW